MSNPVSNQYRVESTSCGCHPETCCCQPWTLWDGDHEIAKGMQIAPLERIAAAANRVAAQTAESQFVECDTCRAKPGSPTLCAGCLNNRRVIESLSHLRRAQKAEAYPRCACGAHEWGPNTTRITDVNGQEHYRAKCATQVKTSPEVAL